MEDARKAHRSAKSGPKALKKRQKKERKKGAENVGEELRGKNPRV